MSRYRELAQAIAGPLELPRRSPAALERVRDLRSTLEARLEQGLDLWIPPGARRRLRDVLALVQSDRSLEDVLSRAERRLAPLLEPEYSTRAQVVYGSNNTQTTMLGVTPEYLSVANWEVARGRFIDELDLAILAKVVVLGASAAEDLFEGSLLEPVGQTVKIIVGQEGLDEGFEAMTRELENLGLEQMMADRQVWYDANK